MSEGEGREEKEEEGEGGSRRGRGGLVLGEERRHRIGSDRALEGKQVASEAMGCAYPSLSPSPCVGGRIRCDCRSRDSPEEAKGGSEKSLRSAGADGGT